MVVVFQSSEQAQKRRSQISLMDQGIQCHLAEATTKEAHLYLINQLARDLGGMQWARYDVEFREWAAAKGVCRWEPINLWPLLVLQVNPWDISHSPATKRQKSKVCYLMRSVTDLPASLLTLVVVGECKSRKRSRREDRK